jgi:DNA-binding transcriptional LysR family regulator
MDRTMIFDVRKLKTLVVVAEEKSFRAAAERLNTSQPWVSEQVKQFEEMLDLPLFERAKGRFGRLTANGEAFVAIARRVVETCEDAAVEMEALRNRDRKRMVLGVDPVTLYIPERNRLMSDFMRKMPGLDLEVVNEQPQALFAGLRSGRFDLLLTLCPNPDEEIEVLPLYRYELKLFVPRSVVGRPPFLDPTGVRGAEVLILPDSYHPAFFAWLKSSFAPAGFSWTACPEVSFHALIRYAVMMGLPTLSPDFSEQMPEQLNEMEIRPAATPRPIMAEWALMRGPGYRRRAADAFWKLAATSAPLP